MSHFSRVLTLALSTALAGGLVYWFAQRRSPESVRAVFGDAAALDSGEELGPRLAAARAGAVHPFEADRPLFPPSAFRRRPLTLEELERLFPGHRPGTEYDPQDYYHTLGDSLFEIPFPEYPGGTVVVRTNALGHKALDQVRSDRPELRVFVTGDSHAFGVCRSDETFTARLQRRLSAAGRDAEVLNAACGGYSFLHYLGSLERHLALAPDVAVAVVYGGNDFEEVLPAHHYLAGGSRPWKGPEHRALVEAGAEIHNGAVYQGFLALSYFAAHPEQVEVALQAARDASLEFVVTSLRHAAHPVFVYVPPAHEVAWEQHAGTFEALARHFGLAPEHLDLFRRMGDSYLAYLRSLRVDVVDLRPHFRSAGRKFYWDSDLHIALDAHELIAEQLEPLLQAARPADARRVRLAAAPPTNNELLSPGAARVEGHRTLRVSRASLPAPLIDLGDGGFDLSWPTDDERTQLHKLTPLHRADPKALFTYRVGLGAQPAAPHFRTNALTLVAGSDGKVKLDKPRVLLLGDEYVFGPSSQGDPCGSMVEQHVGVDCLDATTLGYGPQLYLGAFDNLARAKPQVVVVQLSPNDLFEAYEFDRQLRALRGEHSGEAAAARAPIDLAVRPTAADVAQRWTRRPASAAAALELSLRAALELRRRCEAQGARLVLVVLPSSTDPRIGAQPLAPGEALDADVLVSTQASFARTLRFWGLDVLEFAEQAQLDSQHFEGVERLSPAGRAELARVVAARVATVLEPFAVWR